MPARTLGLLLGLSFLIPGSAWAQSGGTFGSPLTAPNNYSIGCEVILFGNGNGDPQPFLSNQPDCTWRQAAVVGTPPGDQRGSYVPGTGRIVQMEVKSGPNPAPLRVTVMSQINDFPSTGPAGICCFFEKETQLFPISPNTITTVPLDIPVQREVYVNKLVTDAVGVSAASGTGALPLARTGSQNQVSGYTFGSPAVGWFYPRLGPQDGRNTGGRPEQGMPGTELLVRWTWVPAGTPAGAGAALPTQPIPQNTTIDTRPLGLVLRGGFANIRSNNALIEVACRGNAICEGELAIINLGGLAQKKKAVTYYSKKKKYKIAAGKDAIVKAALTRKARRLLKNKKQLKVALRITPKGGTATTTKLTLRKKK